MELVGEHLQGPHLMISDFLMPSTQEALNQRLLNEQLDKVGFTAQATVISIWGNQRISAP